MMVSLEETSQSVRPEKAASRMSRRTLFRAPWLVLPGVAPAKDALSGTCHSDASAGETHTLHPEASENKHFSCLLLITCMSELQFYAVRTFC